MRAFLAGCVVLGHMLVTDVCGAVAGGEPVEWVAWHFLGAAQVAGDTNGTRLRAVLAQPSTQPLVERALDGLSRAASSDPQGAARVRSFLDEVLRSESLGAVRGESDSGPEECIVALRVGSARTEQLVADWPALAAAVGCQETKTTVSGDWFIGGLGRGAAPDLKTLEKRVAGVAQATASDAAWIELSADLEWCAKAFGWPASIPWPRAQFAFAGRGQNMRTTAEFTYARPLNLPLEKWEVPTNTVREPLLSFTAIQGVRPWLAERPVLTELDWPAPNQVFSWAQSQVPYQTQFAWQMSDAVARIKGAQPKIKTVVSALLPWLNFGGIEFIPELSRLLWTGFPILVPFINPAADPGFVLAGIFPVANPREAAPPELYAQLWGRTNLVYYDWELTQPRLEDWRSLDMLHAMIAGYAPPPTNSIVRTWLQDTNVTSHLGNCVTEVTQTSPSELRAVRNSAVGLTAFELHRIVLWLEGEAFPRRTPPKPALAVRKEAGRTNAPAAER